MAAVTLRRGRLLQVTLFAALAMLSPAAYANSCNWTLLGNGNWTTPGNWSGCGGGYPGQTVTDTANITGLSLSITVTVDQPIPNPVNLQVSLLLLPATISIPSGNSLTLATGSAATSTTINVAGTLGVASGATISNFGGDITVNGGTINSLGSMTMGSGSTFTLNGGTLQGAGTFGTASGATANFGGGSLAINSSLNFANAGTLHLTNDTTVTTNGVGNPGITNSGTLAKTGGTGISEIDCRVDNSGTVNAGGLQIYLAGGGTQTGTFSGNIVAFNGTHVFNAGADVSALSAFYLKGGTLTSNLASLSLPTTHHFAGTLQTSGSINANGAYTWDAGVLDGLNAPAPSLTATSMGGMNITNASGATSIINNMTLAGSSATITYQGQTAGLSLDNGGKINLSLSTLDVQDPNGHGIASVGAGTSITIGASSTMLKSAGGTSAIAPPVTNNSNLTVNAGALQIAGGGTSIGTITNAASLQFTGGTFTITAGTLAGAGTYMVNGGTLSLSVSKSVANFSMQSGFLQILGGNTLTFTSGLQFDGGTITGSGIAKLALGATATIPAGNMAYVDGGTTLEIAGTANYTAGTVAYLELTNGSSLVVDGGAQFNVNTAGEIGSDTASNVISNAGTVTKANAGTAIFDVPFNNTGALNVTGGELDLERGGTSSAPFTVSSGGTLAFTAIGYNLTAGSAMNGLGIYKLTGTAQLNVNTPLPSPQTFNQDSGVLGGTADLTIPGGSTYNWTGGIIYSNGGNMLINGGSLLINTAAAAVTLDTRTITFNSGTMRWSGTNTLTMKQGAAINLSATFDIQASGTLASDTYTGGSSTRRLRPNGVSTQTITVNPGGTLQKSTGGAMIIAADVNSGGTIAALSGGLLALSGTATVTHTGTFNAASGSTIDFSGGTHNMGAVSFPGTGLIKIHGATVNFNAPVSMPNLDLTSGTVGGSSSVSTTTSFTWQGGTIAAPVNLSIGGTGTLNGAVGALTLGGTLTVAGTSTTTFNSANTLSGSGSILNNGTFLNAGPTDIGVAFSNNGGGIYQYQLLATHNFTGAFSNAGNAQFTGGTENFTSTYTQSAGTTTLGPGNIGVTTLTLNGGILNGNGTITGNVNNNAGSVNPGTSPGSITINGNYTQGASGIFNVDLNGTTPGTTYDQLNVSGLATLAGTINGTLGYTPANNDTFNVLTFGSHSGDFTTYNLPPVAGPPPGTIQHSITANAVQLLVAVPQADVVVTQSAAPSPILNGQTATYTITVRNNGPNPASGITVTNSFTGGVFSSVSSTGGASCGGTGPVTCTIANLNFGSTETITLVLMGNAVGSMINTASATSTSADPVPGNNSASATVTINGSADLSDAISGGPATVVAGQNASYTVTITNAGPDPATPAVNFSITGGTLISASGAGFTCTTPASCIGSALAASSNATITVVSQAQAQAGTMTLTANVGPLASDPNTTNNSATVSTAVTASADIQVTKTSTSPLVAGATTTYNIDVKNAGPSDAAAVNLSDPTPGGLTLVSVSGGGCSSFPCSLGNLAAGSVTTITATYSLTSSASGPITNTATANSTGTPDPNAANNSASVTGTIVQKADVAVSKTGPGSASPGSNVTFTITVTNNGPSDAQLVQLGDPTPARLTFVSATGACTSFPCSLGTMTPAQVKTIQATYTVLPGPTTTIVNTATVTSPTTDLVAGNNSSAASLTTGCATSAPGGLSPANGVTNAGVNGTLSWSNVNAASYKVYLGVEGSGCSTQIANVGALSIPYGGLNPGTTYEWRVEATTNGCPTFSSPCSKFTTSGSAVTCPTTPPTLVSPINGNVGTSATFQWSGVAGATLYRLFVNDAQVATTTATTAGPITVPTTAVTWYVVAEFGPSCAPVQSQKATFNGCDTSGVPIPSLVGQAASGQGYDFSWTAPNGATKFEADESTDIAFSPSLTTTQTTTSNSLHFQHTVSVPTAFYYRVRAFVACSGGFTANSVTMRVVLAPVVAPTNPNQSVQVGNKTLVSIPVHVPGFPNQTLPFTATLDNKPWLKSVTPSSGVLPPEGVDLLVLADPDGLPNGTFTGTVILLVTTPGSGTIANNGVTPVGVPVSISLVTPVTPKPAGNPPANALIIPSVGHLDGINSHWQSDIRVANTSQQSARYQLTFTPDDAAKGVKQTIINVDGGVTTALDDIIKTWYGVGSLGESANGVLEIRPLDNPAKGGPANDDVSVSLTTVASSRTYNIASNSVSGTLGQFIPAIPFGNFIGRAQDSAHAATVLGLQQIAQNDAYRTNVGVVEASGNPASVMLSAFDASGKKLLDFPLDLKANEQRQLNSFLAQNNIAVNDGRIEVKVTSGDGKVTAYASVVDNKSGDPLLVSGVPLGQNAFDHYVLPGVADLNTGFAAWRTDMRIFNPTSTPQFVTLNFYPQNSSDEPQMVAMTVNAGEVKKLDNTMSAVFGKTNAGGAVHITTGGPTPLVVTGRTYNLTSNGTFGQFIPAVTSADAVGKGDRGLNILQAEDSVRYRTNVGIAEVTGKPATVEVQVILPDSKIAPSTQIPIAANGFVQVPLIQSLGLTNVYNARISLRVVDGDGKVAAYGSVIDQTTQDPTYVPAQK